MNLIKDYLQKMEIAIAKTEKTEKMDNLVRMDNQVNQDHQVNQDNQVMMAY